jgi:calcineurin-like phosphoesterase family protein
MKISLDTWVVSDTHFGHDNIIRYCDRPENHNDLMLANWNAVVGDNDVVLHLGDLVWKKSLAIDYVRALKGRKHLIKGNHDHQKDVWYDDQGFKVMPQKMFFNWGGKIVLFTHRPEGEFADWDINIHGHIHNNGHRDDEPLLPGKDYRNVSIEVMDYTPVRLREILGA